MHAYVCMCIYMCICINEHTYIFVCTYVRGRRYPIWLYSGNMEPQRWQVLGPLQPSSGFIALHPVHWDLRATNHEQNRGCMGTILKLRKVCDIPCVLLWGSHILRIELFTPKVLTDFSQPRRQKHPRNHWQS